MMKTLNRTQVPLCLLRRAPQDGSQERSNGTPKEEPRLGKTRIIPLTELIYVELESCMMGDYLVQFGEDFSKPTLGRPNFLFYTLILVSMIQLEVEIQSYINTYSGSSVKLGPIHFI